MVCVLQYVLHVKASALKTSYFLTSNCNSSWAPFTCDVQLVDDTGERQSKMPALLKSLPKLHQLHRGCGLRLPHIADRAALLPLPPNCGAMNCQEKNTRFKLDGEHKLLLIVSRNSGWRSLRFAACPFYPCFSVFLPHKTTLHNRSLTPLQLLRGL